MIPMKIQDMKPETVEIFVNQVKTTAALLETFKKATKEIKAVTATEK